MGQSVQLTNPFSGICPFKTKPCAALLLYVLKLLIFCLGILFFCTALGHCKAPNYTRGWVSLSNWLIPFLACVHSIQRLVLHYFSALLWVTVKEPIIPEDGSTCPTDWHVFILSLVAHTPAATHCSWLENFACCSLLWVAHCNAKI